MSVLSGFALDADISVSELREEQVLDQRLQQHHRLRVRRRNDVLGVLVDAKGWRELERYVHALEAALERYEQRIVDGLIAERAPDADFVQGTPEAFREIERHYNTLIKGE